MAKDRIKIEILEDGRIKATTGKISMSNHLEADEALAELTKLLAGEETRESAKSEKPHTHSHKHGGHHSH